MEFNTPQLHPQIPSQLLIIMLMVLISNWDYPIAKALLPPILVTLAVLLVRGYCQFREEMNSKKKDEETNAQKKDEETLAKEIKGTKKKKKK